MAQTPVEYLATWLPDYARRLFPEKMNEIDRLLQLKEKAKNIMSKKTDLLKDLRHGSPSPLMTGAADMIEADGIALDAMNRAYKSANDQLNAAGSIIQYPDEWDTACYETLAQALEHLRHCGDLKK